MIGTPVRSAAETKPPRPNRCSLYRSRERLADALEALGAHRRPARPADSSRSASALQASVLPALRASGPRNGRLEHQVGAEHPQRAGAPGGGRAARPRSSARRPAIVPEWLATTSAPPVSGMFSMPQRLDPEPLLVQRPQRRQEDVVGEVGVEAEVVDLVVAGQPAAQEGQRAGQAALPTGLGADGGDLFGCRDALGRRGRRDALGRRTRSAGGVDGVTGAPAGGFGVPTPVPCGTSVLGTGVPPPLRDVVHGCPNRHSGHAHRVLRRRPRRRRRVGHLRRPARRPVGRGRRRYHAAAS